MRRHRPLRVRPRQWAERRRRWRVTNHDNVNVYIGVAQRCALKSDHRDDFDGIAMRDHGHPNRKPVRRRRLTLRCHRRCLLCSTKPARTCNHRSVRERLSAFAVGSAVALCLLIAVAVFGCLLCADPIPMRTMPMLCLPNQLENMVLRRYKL